MVYVKKRKKSPKQNPIPVQVEVGMESTLTVFLTQFNFITLE